MLPELHIAVGNIHAAGRDPLAIMTRGAAERFRWMVCHYDVILRMRFVRIGLIFKASLVNTDMTGLAAVQRALKAYQNCSGQIPVRPPA